MCEPVNGLTHAFSAVVSAAVLVWMLVIHPGGWGGKLALTVYGLSLVGMFSASASYHLARVSDTALSRLRKLDHSAIYLLIAGTYTPICLHFFSGIWRWGLLGTIWGMALIGIVVKLFVIRAPRWVTAGVYLLMGWLSILAVRQMLATMPAAAIVWLVLGGVFYSLGALIYILKKPDPLPGVFGFHEIWHIFVMLGAFSHLVVVAVYVAPFLR